MLDDVTDAPSIQACTPLRHCGEQALNLKAQAIVEDAVWNEKYLGTLLSASSNPVRINVKAEAFSEVAVITLLR